MTLLDDPFVLKQRRTITAYRKKFVRLEKINADLLEALKEVVSISDRKHDAWDKARAVIARAEGRTPDTGEGHG